MSGRRSKRSQAKAALFTAALICFFVYANLTAQTNSYTADVTILPDGKLTESLAADISNAKESIYIAVYMFKSYDKVSTGAGLIKKLLENAADRGIKVYIALDSDNDGGFVNKENHKLGSELQKHGATVVYDNPEQRMHSKCAVIDEKISYIGSHNYTNSALGHNRELTVRIVSEEAAKDAVQHILSIK